MSLEKELTIERVDDELRISISVGILAFAVENNPSWPLDWVTDPEDNYAVFTKSIIQSLKHEEEDGTTLVHRMLDAAAIEALDQGYEGFVYAE